MSAQTPAGEHVWEWDVARELRDSKNLRVEVVVTTVVFPLTSHALLGGFIVSKKMEGNPENKNSVTVSGTVWAF